jgi:rod shape-determining protein MreC
MRRRDWGWTSTGRRRYAILALLVGHLGWILLGRGSASRWETLLNLLTDPGRRVSGRMESWKASRRSSVASLGEARAEVARLRATLDGLQTQRAAETARMAEADEAVRLLGLRKLLPLEFKAARVLANLRRAPFGGLVLDQGAEDGLAPDLGVICPEGVVGRIWAAGYGQSTVLTLDAYNASTAVMLARSRATGVLQGVGPGKAEIRYIGSQEVVQTGEPVYTSGLDRVFPRGLLVGYVAAVHPRDVELRVEVNLAANLDRVHLVLILPSRPQVTLPSPSEPEERTGRRGTP